MTDREANNLQAAGAAEAARWDETLRNLVALWASDDTLDLRRELRPEMGLGEWAKVLQKLVQDGRALRHVNLMQAKAVINLFVAACPRMAFIDPEQAAGLVKEEVRRLQAANKEAEAVLVKMADSDGLPAGLAQDVRAILARRGLV